MSLTVPPPRDDDHDDVAWALRAASAQWRRDATADAVGWVRRAAETAEEVGAQDRAAELSQLANELAGGPVAVAPPPPSGALSMGSDEVEINVEMVDDVDELDDLEDVEEVTDLDDVEDLDEIEDLDGAEVEDLDGAEVEDLDGAEVEDLDGAEVEDLDGDEIEALDDVVDIDDEVEDLDDEVEDLDDDDDIVFDDSSLAPSAPDGFAASPAPTPLGSLPKKAPSVPPPVSQTPSRRRPTTSSGVDLPPSMRPNPSGLDLDEDVLDDEDDEFGELEFEDEVPTNKVSVPPAPDLGEVSMDGPEEVPLLDETAAEYATSRHPGSAREDHEEIEKELGVDLSIRVPGQAPSVPVQNAPSAPAPTQPADDSVRVGAPHASFGQSIAMEPPADSVEAPPPLEDDPFGSAVSPVPGRTSVRPSNPPPEAPIQVSAESEPFGLAPSADLPPAAAMNPPAIEPPQHPSAAPPSHVMEEPEEHPSVLPPPPSEITDEGEEDSLMPPPSIAAVSSAPEPDDLDDMFAAISQPPPKPDAQAAPPSVNLEAPAPPVVEDESAVGAGGLPLDISEDAIVLDGIDLLEIQGLQDLPDEDAQALAQSAKLVTLEKGEEVSAFGVALVTHGAVQLMPTVADAPCAFAQKGDVLFVKGTLKDEVAVRAVGFEPGSRVATFSKEALAQATSQSPWVGDELAEVADKYLAFAGAVLGPLGDSLDDTFRFMVLEKCSVKSKAEGDMIAQAGESLNGMYIVGGGTIELLAADGSVEEELGAGDFIYPETVLSAGPASGAVRVGAGGALLLYADRMGAHELLATCPPFIELLAGGGL